MGYEDPETTQNIYINKHLDSESSEALTISPSRSLEARTTECAGDGPAPPAITPATLRSLALFTQPRQVIESFDVVGPTSIAAIASRAVVARDLLNGLKRGQVFELTGRTERAFREGLISAIVDVS